FQIAPSAGLYLGDPSPNVAFSPDGHRLVYTASTLQPQLYLRSLDRDDDAALAGTTNARNPFFSPDGEWIGYFQGADLKRMSVHGGPALTICQACGGGNRGATWGGDDTIVFSFGGGGQGLRRVAAAGGDPVPITTVDTQKGEAIHAWPEWLP